MSTMKNWKQRYRDMGTLFWVVVVILLLGVTTEAYCVADIFRQAEPDKALAGIYAWQTSSARRSRTRRWRGYTG